MNNDVRNLPDMFGTMVFGDRAMKEKMPHDVYTALKRTVAKGEPLKIELANSVANAMKDWAIERGATHFTHWFQPLTGVTAEKHDSFISPDGDGGVIMKFSGKALIKGEPDASSLPSGGLRATFEARGYTAWDPTSYAFIKNNTLCIPTAFCSFSGDALDKKTPLLRSMEAVEKQALRILRLFGNTKVRRVMPSVGAEQEYFLIDKSVYEKRPDLIYCGRTLLGANSPKSQEMENHYFGAIKPRVQAFMRELDEELWKLGVFAQTEHNETAPAQHELAPVFDTANLATDQNQLTMEMMKIIAARHGMVCLLHEKPFNDVNGSGKHNNWSLSTDKKVNLLEPGETPSQNAQFLLFLTAVIKAVCEHQDLLRIVTTSAGNDKRLGGHEAPPAIISMFLGDELTDILDAIERDSTYIEREHSFMEIGAMVLPKILKDTTDRNRTSPFAFTGNKFEFRMVGSSQSIADANIVLNTIVADALMSFADKLEDSLETSKNFGETLHKLIRDTIKENRHIVFNGNNYSEEWQIEAERRGLLNLKSTPDALAMFASESNIELFARHGVYSESEIRSRAEIMAENYYKTIHIEALTMMEMVHQDIIPAVISYEKEIARTLESKTAVGLNSGFERKLLETISDTGSNAVARLEELEEAINGFTPSADPIACAKFYYENVDARMIELRKAIDKLETVIAKKYWPYPSYGEMLYSVK